MADTAYCLGQFRTQRCAALRLFRIASLVLSAGVLLLGSTHSQNKGKNSSNQG